VKIFLDECVDWRLLRSLVGHDVKSARQMGWTEIKNGQLLALVAARFDVFLTVDQNLPHQQNYTDLDVAIVVLKGKTSRLADLRPHVPEFLALLPSVLPGWVYKVPAEPS
jgi:hypothetical protein